MRVSVLFGDIAVGGPAGMTDTHVPMYGGAGQHIGEARQFAYTATDVEGTGVVDGNPGRIIAAILQAGQPSDDQRGSLTQSDISYKSTHC